MNPATSPRGTENRKRLSPSRKLQLAQSAARADVRGSVMGLVFAAIHTHRFRFKLERTHRSD